jgi:hypothetical protein
MQMYSILVLLFPSATAASPQEGKMLTHGASESRVDSKRAEGGRRGDIKINKVCKLVSKRVFRQAQRHRG